jgi:hypothetical protein
VICYCIQEEEEAAAEASAISWLFGSQLEGSDCFILIVSDVCSDKSGFPLLRLLFFSAVARGGGHKCF